MRSEKDSESETYALNSNEEYATPYQCGADSVHTKPYATVTEAGFSINARSLIDRWQNYHYQWWFSINLTILNLFIKIRTKQKYDHEYDEYGSHYADYQNHSNCGRKINFETEYAEYECRSETNSGKKEKTHFRIKLSIICLVLIILGEIIYPLTWNIFYIFEALPFTEQLLWLEYLIPTKTILLKIQLNRSRSWLPRGKFLNLQKM